MKDGFCKSRTKTESHDFAFTWRVRGNKIIEGIFEIPTAAMLSKIVAGIDKLELGDEDSKGDLYD